MIVNYFKPLSRTFLGDTLGRNDPFTSITSNQLITDGSGYKSVYTGNFVLNQTGFDYERSYISKLEVFQNGALIVSYQNMNISPQEFVDSYVNGGNSGLDSRVYKFDDRINGSNGNDFLDCGFGGKDSIMAGAGNDFIFSGGDTLNELNTIDGGSGLDTIYVGTYNWNPGDYAFGGAYFAKNTTGYVIDYRTYGVGSYSLSNIEYVVFENRTIDLIEYALGSPVPDDKVFSPVHRFAKLSNGQYFYTGNQAEVFSIKQNYPDFRYEGVVFSAQDGLTTGYLPVYRFANLDNGGYFYTSNKVERDSVLSNYPQYRFEGVSFFVPESGGMPVYRLANTNSGGYLFTSDPKEVVYAKSLGFFRDEGVAFYAPDTFSGGGKVVQALEFVDAQSNGLTSPIDVECSFSDIGDYPNSSEWLF